MKIEEAGLRTLRGKRGFICDMEGVICHGSAYVIGEAVLTNALYEAGFSMNDVNPDYVVVGEIPE